MFSFARRRNLHRTSIKSKQNPSKPSLIDMLEARMMLSGTNLNELVDTTPTAVQLAQSLVGAGVSVSNVKFTGGVSSTGRFNFTDPKVIGFGQGIILSSGNAADVVGPNNSDSNSTDWALPGDPNLDALSGFTTYDASVLEFDFVPTANQVVFNYVFSSDEYPEWVNTGFNDVFGFYVNNTNYATVRQTAGDPTSPFVPVAVNNINNGNPLDPSFVPTRPDLFRPNYFDPNGAPSPIDLEMDGLTSVLTFQAPVTPGIVNHMKLAIADASDGIYDSAVFIQAGSLVSNENPVADLSLSASTVAANQPVTAIIEGEDPNGLPITYSIDWGDGTTSTGPLSDPTNKPEKTALVDHIYTQGGTYIVKLTVSNGSLSGTSIEDLDVTGGTQIKTPPVVTKDPLDQTVNEGDTFTFTAAATGTPTPTVQWQVSTDGITYTDIPGATQPTYTATATLDDNGKFYQAVFTNEEDSATSAPASLTVVPVDTIAPDAPIVTLANDTGADPTDNITSDATLSLGSIELDALVEYSTDSGQTWSGTFTASEGLNTVLVRQTDAAGNTSDATSFAFTLDTLAPAAPDIALANDTGASSTDGLTNDPTVALTGLEDGALTEYSTDNGQTWSTQLITAEGLNSVQARQTDLAGNTSDVTTFSFVLDTTVAAPSVSLAQDTGASSTDRITRNGALNVTGIENGAAVEYSIDDGKTWTNSFTAVEGNNTVLVRQTDSAGNISTAATLTFTLDTTAPTLSPTFNITGPILVSASGIVLSPNASDLFGIASQSTGPILTTTAGQKFVTCTATDLAGNTITTQVVYTVGYQFLNLTPLANTTFKHNESIAVTFQIADANGVLSDSAASSLLSSLSIDFEGTTYTGIKYNTKTNTFSLNLKPKKTLTGLFDITLHVKANGAEVTTAIIPVKIV